MAKTGKLPDHLRGGWGDYIILDEYAYQNPIVWTKVVAPMTLDTNATIVFISTPDFRNHFYHLYLKALIDDRWDVITFSSLENPHLSQEALDDFMYNKYPFQIFAMAEEYKNAMSAVNQIQSFGEKNKLFKTVLISKIKGPSITATFAFLQKVGCRAKNIMFIDDDYLGNAYFETDINLIKGTVPGN